MNVVKQYCNQVWLYDRFLVVVCQPVVPKEKRFFPSYRGSTSRSIGSWGISWIISFGKIAKFRYVTRCVIHQRVRIFILWFSSLSIKPLLPVGKGISKPFRRVSIASNASVPFSVAWNQACVFRVLSSSKNDLILSNDFLSQQAWITLQSSNSKLGFSP